MMRFNQAKNLTLYHTIPTFKFKTLEMKPFESIVGKGENAGNQHFLLFPVFSTLPNLNFNFSVTFILSSASSFNLEQSKNFCLVKS